MKESHAEAQLPARFVAAYDETVDSAAVGQDYQLKGRCDSGHWGIEGHKPRTHTERSKALAFAWSKRIVN